MAERGLLARFGHWATETDYRDGLTDGIAIGAVAVGLVFLVVSLVIR